MYNENEGFAIVKNCSYAYCPCVRHCCTFFADTDSLQRAWKFPLRHIVKREYRRLHTANWVKQVRTRRFLKSENLLWFHCFFLSSSFNSYLFFFKTTCSLKSSQTFKINFDVRQLGKYISGWLKYSMQETNVYHTFRLFLSNVGTYLYRQETG
jgi:hypothetical protein